MTNTSTPDLRTALKLAEAALSDIGDADHEPGDDLAWCEARAAKALPAIRAALAATAQAVPESDIYVWPVPDKCDRIVWRGAYHHLPIQKAAPAPARCKSCGTHEVSQQQTCHNSGCADYAQDVTIYEGWKSHTPASSQPVAAPVDATDLTQAARDVLAERQRQINAEGRTLEGDDQYTDGELSGAAASYAIEANALAEGMRPDATRGAPFCWPWIRGCWKPSSDPRRNLIKSGALILAEIERLDRDAAQPATQKHRIAFNLTSKERQDIQ